MFEICPVCKSKDVGFKKVPTNPQTNPIMIGGVECFEGEAFAFVCNKCLKKPQQVNGIYIVSGTDRQSQQENT